jgi:integrase
MGKESSQVGTEQDEEEERLMPQLERFPETRAAVILTLNTGLRKMGILTRKVSDVDAQNRTLRYIAKGGGVKHAPLNPQAWAVIEELMEHPTKEGFLFHSRKGHSLSAPRGAFQLSVARSGITDLHFHDLRHTFSTRIRNLTDAFTVRDLMGHKDVNTTNIYVEESLSDMRKAVEALSSRGKVIEFKRTEKQA